LPKARRRARLRFELPIALLGLAILGLLIAINFLCFAVLGEDYFGWYLASGFIVTLVFGVVGIAVDLDRYPGLIAAHPFTFVRDTALLLAALSGAAGQ
jgi:hypothetical protein